MCMNSIHAISPSILRYKKIKTQSRHEMIKSKLSLDRSWLWCKRGPCYSHKHRDRAKMSVYAIQTMMFHKNSIAINSDIKYKTLSLMEHNISVQYTHIAHIPITYRRCFYWPHLLCYAKCMKPSMKWIPDRTDGLANKKSRFPSYLLAW